MGTPGDLLRSAREGKRLSLEQIEQATRIRAKLLEALEQGDYAQFPAPVFVKGFLRNYAQFLELNPEDVLRAYRAEVGETAQVFTPKALAEPLERSRSPLASLTLALLLVALVGVGAWWSYSQGWVKIPAFPTAQSRDAASPATTTSLETTAATTGAAATFTLTPAPTETARTETAVTATRTFVPPATPTTVASATPTPTTPIALAGIHVELQISARAWMRVYADGKRVFEGFAEKDTTQSWDAAKQLYIHCGYGSGVRAIVNGQDYGPLSQEPDTVRVEWTLAVGTPSVENMIIPTQIVLPLGLPIRPLSITPTGTPTR